MANLKSWWFIMAALLLCGNAAAGAQGVTVKAQVSVDSRSAKQRQAERDSRVVMWLVPEGGWEGTPRRAQSDGLHPQLVQKNKRFTPHVLAVQVGSAVDFPNHDPFFHNVFSLFNGKRFDLGLYEAGSTRSVHFDRTGICYIFCNIHPQMSAIVVVVDTPYFSISNSTGEVAIPNVPAGRYRMHIWEEHCPVKNLKEASRPVEIGADNVSLGSIHLEEDQKMVMVHPNKYGRDYDPQVFSSPIYSQP